MEQVMEENSQLRSEVEGNMHQRNTLSNELQSMRSKLEAVAADNLHLGAEVKALRQSLQVCFHASPPSSYACFLPPLINNLIRVVSYWFCFFDLLSLAIGFTNLKTCEFKEGPRVA
jgi:hypothetical protein